MSKNENDLVPAMTLRPTRRILLGGAVGLALAMLAGPGLAAAIQTGSDGLTIEEVKIAVTGGTLSAYCAYPAKGGKFPTILLAHDVFGVNPQLQDVARRLAKAGYYVIAPNLFSRQGDISKITDEIDIMRSVVAKVTDADINADLDAVLAFVKKSGKGDEKRLGMTGFGWGGRVVWLYAAHEPKLKAAVAWYGFLNAPRDPNGHSAIALAGQIKPPVLGLYGNKDDYILESDTIAMKNALAGKKSEIVLFPGVKHGFMADDRPNYDAKAAADGWERMSIWFKNNGVQ